MHYDFLILGSGISGLTSALILGKHGYKVAIIEKNKKIAPLLRGFYRQQQYFDTGLHYLGGLEEGGILNTYFNYLGLSQHIKKIPFNPDGFDILRFLDKKEDIYFPYGYQNIEKKLTQKFPQEQEAIQVYLKKIKQNYTSSPLLNLDEKFFQKEPYYLYKSPSLGSFLDKLTSQKYLKTILCSHCLLHGVSPYEVSFRFHSMVVGSYYDSVHTIEGGGRNLVYAFKKELKKNEIDIYCGYGAKKIKISTNGKFSGIELDNKEIIQASACISTLHPSTFIDIVPNHIFRPAYIKRLKSFEETSSAFIFFGKISESSPIFDKRAMLIFPTSNIEVANNIAPMINSPAYISIGQDSSCDKKSVVIIVYSNFVTQQKRYCSSNSLEYQKNKHKVMQKILSYIKTVCPELSNLEYVDGATPHTFKSYLNSPTGSLYGIKHKIGQYSPMPITKIKGLYLAGQSIVAPGILGAMVSAFLVCGMIIGYKKLQTEVKKWI
ncbi:all-trans-retinol 13,14-reductase [Desulfonauticus submarinus]|uniref:All-trans-retinol 13,14-reductase n=1 Tax=Desulfonauticus submarinus TaxID=206665 RepID=A0A1H0FT78_9BACT|nr:NAD(P)-binding protein [Desulfonauticus submarinus]SDN97845.1 all-trans-retinol 13,14-reductase [Desulfonauticus submarinus]